MDRFIKENMKKLILVFLLFTSSLFAVEGDYVMVPKGTDPNTLWATGITNGSSPTFVTLGVTNFDSSGTNAVSAVMTNTTLTAIWTSNNAAMKSGTNVYTGSTNYFLGIKATGLNITTNSGTNIATGFVLWTNGTGSVGPSPMFNTVTTTNATATNSFAGVISGKVRSPTFHVELTAVTPSIYIVPNVVQSLILTNNIQDSFSGYSTNTGRYTIPQSWGPCQYKVYGAACAGYGSTQTVQYGFFEVTPLFATNLLCYGQVTKTPVGNVPMIPWIGVINYTGGLHQVYPFAYTDTVTNWITNLTGRTMFNVDAGGAP